MAALMRGGAKPQPHNLADMAALVRAAMDGVAQARADLARDKDRRPGSFVARLVDGLSSRAAETVLVEAEAKLVTLREQGWAYARQWIKTEATMRMHALPEVAKQRDELVLKLAYAQRRTLYAHRWLRLAREAGDRMRAAHTASSSAAEAENSKAAAAQARDAIGAAHRALRALADALPRISDQPDIERADDLVEMAAGLMDDVPADVECLFFVDSLDTAAIQCEQAADRLRAVVLRLAHLGADAKAESEREAQALGAMERPYLQAAAAEVPDLLRVPVPAFTSD